MSKPFSSNPADNVLTEVSPPQVARTIKIDLLGHGTKIHQGVPPPVVSASVSLLIHVAVLLTLFLSHAQEDVPKRIVIEIATPNDEMEMVTDAMPDEVALAIEKQDATDLPKDIPLTTIIQSANSVALEPLEFANEAIGFAPALDDLFGGFDALASAGGTQAFGLEMLEAVKGDAALFVCHITPPRQAWQ